MGIWLAKRNPPENRGPSLKFPRHSVRYRPKCKQSASTRNGFLDFEVVARKTGLLRYVQVCRVNYIQITYLALLIYPGEANVSNYLMEERGIGNDWGKSSRT